MASVDLCRSCRPPRWRRAPDGDRRAEGHDAVDGRVGAEGRRHRGLHARRVGDLAGQDLALGRAAVAEQAIEVAVAAQGQRLVADLLVEADAVLDAGLLHALAGALAGLVLGLADVGEDAEVLEHVRAGVHRDDRDAGRDGLLDGRPEGVGVGDRDDEAVRVLGDGGVDELRHLDHVALGVRGAVVDGHAHVLGGLRDAVAHDAPEAVDGLAVGHDLDVDVALGTRTPLASPPPAPPEALGLALQAAASMAAPMRGQECREIACSCSSSRPGWLRSTPPRSRSPSDVSARCLFLDARGPSRVTAGDLLDADRPMLVERQCRGLCDA